MSTRPTREIAPPAKEKRGTSPSNIPTTTRTTLRGRSPNPPKKPASPARSLDPAPSEKSVPNYVKSTLSLGPEVASKQQGKKPVLKTDTTQKPTLVRRRSLDKPPSTSQTQRSRVSPGPTLRSSSSFSGTKTASPQKKVPDRNLKTPKDTGKQHTLYARPTNTAKKGGIHIKKHETGDNSSTAKEKAVIAPPKVDNTNTHEDQELAIAEAEEEIIQYGDGNEKGDEDSLLENQEPANLEQTEDIAMIVNIESSMITQHVNDPLLEDQKLMNDERAGENKDAKIATSESSSPVLEHQEPVKIEQIEVIKSENAKDSNGDDQEPINNNMNQTEGEVENTDAKIVNFEKSPADSGHENAEIDAVNQSLAVSENQDPEDTNEHEILKEDATNETNNVINSTDDQSAAGNDISGEVEEKKKEGNDEETIGSSKKDEEIIGSSKKDEEAASIGSEAHETKGKKLVNAAAKLQSSYGKKDSAVSNDVIEETASKLREQRKNKVRALAGAFETVISLQETK